MTTYSYAAYDSALVVIDGIRRAVTANNGRFPTRAQVVDAIRTGSGVKGITGTWSFDADGDPTVPGMSYYRVEGGRWALWSP